MFILYIFLIIYACALIWGVADFFHDFVKGILDCIEKIQDSFIKDEKEREKRQFKRYEKSCKKKMFKQFTKEQKEYCKQASSDEEFDRRFYEVISNNPKIYIKFYNEEKERIEELYKTKKNDKLFEQIKKHVLEKMPEEQRNYCQSAKSDKECNKRIREIVSKNKNILYEIYDEGKKELAEQAEKSDGNMRGMSNY